MATGVSGYFDITATKNITVRVKYAETYDISSNKTTALNITLLVSSSNYYGHTYYIDGPLSVDGTVVKEFSSSSGENSVRIAAQNTFYEVGGGPWTPSAISHNADGSKSVKISIAIKGYTTGGNGANGWSASGEKTIALTTIPRASTVTATDANVGAVSAITVNRKATSYTHSIAYKFGSLSGYIDADGNTVSSEKKLTATSIGFSIPTSWYDQLTGAAQATCTLTCKTYSGSTQIGDTQTTTFTVTASQSASAPSVSGTVKDTNSTTKTLTGSNAKLVRYYSTATCTITATAKNSATITEKYINGTLVEDDSLVIENVEASEFVFMAKDSRGYSAQTKVTPTVIPYIKLTVNATCERSDPTSGKATLKISGNYFNGSFGSEDNTLTLQYKINSGSYKTVTPTLKDNTYSITVSLTGLDYDSSHTIKVKSTDKLATVYKSVTVKKGIPIADWGESDFAFHVPISMNGFAIQDLPNPENNGDAVPLSYVLRNISNSSTATMDVGDTFELKESIIGKAPVFATFAYGQCMGRVSGSGSSRTIAFHTVTTTTSGLYIIYAYFGVSTDGKTLALKSTMRATLKASGITVEEDKSFLFGEVKVIA